MSEGQICECTHYLVHHDDDGICLFVWNGEHCECKLYRDDSGPLGNFRLVPIEAEQYGET